MILIQVAIGSLIMVLTVAIHTVGQAVGLRWLITARDLHLERASIWTRSLIVGGLVLIMFLATLVEATLWAVTYYGIGAIPEFEKALYFSTVTYTTVGFGDVVLADRWRLLSAFEGANGIIMFGWTTALIVIAIRRLSRTLKRLGPPD
ncbi:MAG: two pore domain potassium channel family protein [Deltaproteobacteria bacterium]|nr:two pore domain potassium channel family protein [Deltaproteobacteria bacterium]